MTKFFVAGMVNVETTVSVDQFPIEYSPIDYRFYGVESTISGVGMNVSKALAALGGKVNLVSLIGNDIYKASVLVQAKAAGIQTEFIKDELAAIPQSVILYDKQGKRKIILDLKDIQEREDMKFDVVSAAADVDTAVVCNINFARGMLKPLKEAGKTIATDVHVVSDTADLYNKDFMRYADILFMSNENILGQEQAFAKEVSAAFGNEIIAVGMGTKGALLYVKADDSFTRFPAVYTRAVISTVGAGDALFSAFVYFYGKQKDPYQAMKNATVFASYKIGAKGGAEGFLSETEVLGQTYQEII